MLLTRRMTAGEATSTAPRAGEMRGGFRKGLAQSGAREPVGAVGGVIAGLFAAEGEHFQAFEAGLEFGNVVAFAAGDVGDGAQHDGGGDGQFDRQRREAESAADAAGSADKNFVKEFAGAAAIAFAEADHGQLERFHQCAAGGFVHGFVPALRQQGKAFFDGRAEIIRQADGETGVLQQRAGGFQILQLFAGEGMDDRRLLHEG